MKVQQNILGCMVNFSGDCRLCKTHDFQMSRTLFKENKYDIIYIVSLSNRQTNGNLVFYVFKHYLFCLEFLRVYSSSFIQC